MRSWIAATLLALALVPMASCAKREEITSVAADDAKMNAAVAEARATLPIFWKVAEAGDPAVQRKIVKVALPVKGGGQEHLWMGFESHDDRQVNGRLENEPEYLPGLHNGDPVTVDPSQVSDWAYVRGGKMYGAYTMRVVLDQLSPAERKIQMQALAPTPLEPGSH